MKRILIISAIFGSVLAQAQADYELVEISKLNSSYNEFSARAFNNGILFCSNKKNDILISYLNESNDEPLTHIWYAERKSFGKYSSAKPIGFSQIQRTDLGSFSAIGSDTLYFTQSYLGKKGAVLGIFMSVLQNGEWQKPTPFKHNNAAHSLGHPAITPDGKRIYFAANFGNSLGQSDLYYCDLKNGEWTAPQNLGPQINSVYNELFPYIHPDGSLYFSSNRPGGHGQLDIYRVESDENGQTGVILLPEPFNSGSNDYGYNVSADNTHGFVTSDRNGSDDIFEFQMIKPGFTDCPDQEKNSYCYTFYDAEYVPLDTLPIRYEWNLGDGTRVRNLEVDHCYSAPGTYHVELNIVDTLTGDLFFSQASYVLEVKEIEQVYIEVPDTTGMGISVNLHGKNTWLPGFETDTYHWYFDDGKYLEGEEVSHSFLKTGSAEVTLGLRSKANQHGVVQQACVKKTIYILEDWDANLTASLSGGVLPEGTNDDQKSDIYSYLDKDTVALENALSNETIFRVEIKTSKERLSPFDQFFDGVREAYDVYENFIPGDSIFSYAVGNEKEICNTYPIYSYVKSINYDEVHVKAYLPDHVYDLDNFDHIKEEDLHRAIFRTGSIYFEMDDYKLSDEANPTMNKVLDLLNKYPMLQLEVGAHTDQTGSSQYNLNLSRKRAKSVIEYLAVNGINPARLIGVGYGSELPIGNNETESGRKLNRRVEFKVVSNHTNSSN
jgi:outer membrane protein OmpA-like peptidoglycan-associated protein